MEAMYGEGPDARKSDVKPIEDGAWEGKPTMSIH